MYVVVKLFLPVLLHPLPPHPTHPHFLTVYIYIDIFKKETTPMFVLICTPNVVARQPIILA